MLGARNPYAPIEEKLARQMASMKITTVRNEKEVEKICSESEEIKALREKINNAYLNKERIGQMAEKQYRQQREVEEDALMDVAMLRQKELEEIANQERLRREKEAAF